MCSNASQKAGVLAAQVKETCRSRFGCDFPLQCPEIAARVRETTLERHGAADARSIGLQKLLGAHGVTNASQLPGHADKVKQTSLARYGVEHPSMAPAVQARRKQTNNQRYGVDHYVQTVEFAAKCNVTNVERLGVPWPMQSTEVKAKVNWKASAQRRHETMKQNGTYARTETAPENTCYVALCELFGAANVVRHPIVNGWDIDFYVAGPDAYVQLDGVYWHGLDRPIEVIKQFKHPRDVAIYGTWLRDAQRASWFASSGLKLINVTDKLVVRGQRAGTLLQDLRQALNNGTGDVRIGRLAMLQADDLN